MHPTLELKPNVQHEEFGDIRPPDTPPEKSHTEDLQE